MVVRKLNVEKTDSRMMICGVRPATRLVATWARIALLKAYGMLMGSDRRIMRRKCSVRRLTPSDRHLPVLRIL